MTMKKDEVKAVKWYRKAALRGDADAQFNLGVCYAKGEGVEKDEVEAVKWYRKAALQGHADAQFNLGIRYAKGRGVEKDEVEAYKWVLLADAQGNEDAKEAMALVEKELDAAGRREGQKRAREWKPGKP